MTTRNNSDMRTVFDGSVHLDYFRASVDAPYRLLVDALVDGFGVDEPLLVRGDHGYGMGWNIPTADRGTLVVLDKGSHDLPSVRVSGWPTGPVVNTLRARFPGGRASRVDAALDFADVGVGVELVQLGMTHYAERLGMRRAAYFVGSDSTGVEIGAGTSESRLRCYDAALKHPGEFDRPTFRIEHEFKPSTRDRKEFAWGATAEEVLGASSAASEVLAPLGRLLPSAPCRTERTGNFESWLGWIADTQGNRFGELLAMCGGDLSEAMSVLLDPSRRLA